ncbi:MAB_1171c family putative transporter [Salinispora cortesiana]|uniref:MAB_1171c family putative transporter n=1 Tax=Salinispora cortesiana TaxID=1305843 RepID=UPI0003FC4256|nr:MAB_1171c family putative transporter [Salinispora cortesiana]
MDTLLYGICAGAGWATFAYTLRLLRRHPTPARRALCVSFGAFAVGVTLAIPPLADSIETGLGLPNLAKVLAHGCAMTIAASAEHMLLYLALPPAQAAARTRRWVWITAGAYLVMVALYAHTLGYDQPVQLTVEYATDPAVSTYLLILMVVGFFAYCIDISRLCWKFARICGRPWLRRGLRITAAGAAVAMLYSTNKIIYLVAFWSGRQPTGEREIAAVLVTISALLMMIGLTMPAWGPLMPLTRRWDDLRAYRRLGPLWHDLTVALPELELDPQLRRPLVAVRDLDYTLTRRLAEIRDGRLALRPFLDARATQAADALAEQAGLADDDRLATIEAAQLAFGLRAHRAGIAAPQPHPAEGPPRSAGGWAGEITWLTRVAAAYRQSPVVTATLDATQHLTSTDTRSQAVVDPRR